MRRPIAVLSLVPALWIAGCGDRHEEPALAALRAADAAVLGLEPRVERLAPEEVRAARVAREVALAAAGRKDWKGAREVAAGVPEKVRVAAEAARAREADLAEAWARARTDLPNLLYALEDRLDALDGQRRLPPGLDRGVVQATRAELDASRSEWERLEAEGVDPAVGAGRAERLQARLVAALRRVGIR